MILQLLLKEIQIKTNQKPNSFTYVAGTNVIDTHKHTSQSHIHFCMPLKKKH